MSISNTTLQNNIIALMCHPLTSKQYNILKKSISSTINVIHRDCSKQVAYILCTSSMGSVKCIPPPPSITHMTTINQSQTNFYTESYIPGYTVNIMTICVVSSPKRRYVQDYFISLAQWSEFFQCSHKWQMQLLTSLLCFLLKKAEGQAM